jgi:hypothetical protein
VYSEQNGGKEEADNEEGRKKIINEKMATKM